MRSGSPLPGTMVVDHDEESSRIQQAGRQADRLGQALSFCPSLAFTLRLTMTQITTLVCVKLRLAIHLATHNGRHTFFQHGTSVRLGEGVRITGVLGYSRRAVQRSVSAIQ